MKDSRPIAIIGLGYVGLSLALHFAEAGATVIGLDVDAEYLAETAAILGKNSNFNWPEVVHPSTSRTFAKSVKVPGGPHE